MAFIEGQGGQIEKSIGGAGAVVLELWTGISSVASRATQLTGSLCTAVHWSNSSPQHCAALCGQVLFNALSLVCNKNNKNTVDSVNQLCGATQLTGSLCTTVHWGNSSPQNCSAPCKNTVDRLLYSSLWNALHQLCALRQQPSLVLCSKNTGSSSLHSGMLCGASSTPL